PVIKAVVNQVFNGVEQFMADSQSASFGLTIAKEGITTSLQAEFTPDSYCGKFIGGIKNTDASLTAGLPSRKYFAFGGAAMDMKPAAKTVEGVALDQFSMKFTFDKNTPEAAQAQQMINMFYGPNGFNGVMGGLDAKHYIIVMAGDDEMVSSTIAATKKNED